MLNDSSFFLIYYLQKRKEGIYLQRLRKIYV